jgi:hypothetical protein
MKIYLKNKNSTTDNTNVFYLIKDEIYGSVNLKYSTELEQYIEHFKKLKKNHVFGFYGIFQMTKKTSHFYSMYEDMITFIMFLHICEYPLNLISFYKNDFFYPFFYSMNYSNKTPKIFDHDVNSQLLLDLYKYHLTIRLSVYYNIMTSQQISEKILKNLKLRSHNNQIYICHDTPILEYLFSNLIRKINNILFNNKYFIAYNFLTKKILEDSILYGIISWKEITNIFPDTFYLDKILTWAYYHKKNDICFLMHFLFMPDFFCQQLKDQNIENSEIIIWNEPYKLEYRPIKYLICSFTLETIQEASKQPFLFYNNIKKTEHDNYFIYYNY